MPDEQQAGSTPFLQVNGGRLDAEAVVDGVYRFRVSLPADEIRLISGAARPADLKHDVDTRWLGVAVTGVRWEAGRDIFVPISSPLFCDGFHDIETDASGREQWRWTTGNAGFPPNLHPNWRGEALLHLSLKQWEGSHRQPVGHARAALLGSFENLGCDCEFALCQRHYGVEPPLSLLRFSGTSPPKLTQGLNNGFADIDTPEVSKLIWNANRDEYQISTPYFVRSANHRLRQDPTLEAELFRSGLLTLRLLARKLRQDMATARRIFVVKSADPGFDLAAMHRLFAALRRNGPAALLCVTHAQWPADACQVERLDDGLYAGKLQFFAVGEHSRPEEWEAVFAAWLTLCTRTMALHQAC